MKNSLLTKFPYSPFNKYCIRTPLLSVDQYYNLMRANETSDIELKRQLEIPEINEAIYLASPELYKQLIKWRNGEINDEKRHKRLRVTLLKYLIRMATRSTPFGLFAAIGTGTLNSKTKIELNSKNKFKRRSHYDMHFLVEFAIYLANKSNIKKQLHFYPNTSLYKIGARYRYVEYKYQNKRRVYSLESISHSNYLETILNISKTGTTIVKLIDELQKMDIEFKEATSFINELITNQILVSELEPPITGPDFLEDLRTRLLRLNNVDDEIKKIEELQLLIKKLDNNIGNTVEDYHPILKLVSTFQIPFDHKYLIQTDLFSTYKTNTVSYLTIKKIKQGIALLNRISKLEKNKNLERFKTEFIKRYDHARMPLLEVLDVETGIGYIQNPNTLEATPFLDDIVYPVKDSEEEFISTIFSPFQKVLMKKLNKALSNKECLIEISDDDLPNANYNWVGVPDTLSVMTEIVFEDSKEKIVMNYCGSHAAKLLGRFGHGVSSIENLLKEIVLKESQMNLDNVMAEIIHLPESRTGNVLRRPQLRNFEMPYLGKSNLPVNQQIQMKDIVVTVERNSIKLYAQGFDKPILPRSSNAHNYSTNALPVYHFLCDLQTQEQTGFGFSWGSVFKEHIFLPRVVYKDCILSAAQWKVNNQEIAFLFQPFYSKKGLLKALNAWRRNRNIPNTVQLVDGDNTLAINFKNYNSIEMFLEITKNKEVFILEEFFGNWKGVVKSSSQSYCSQFIFTFYNNSKLQDVKNNKT